MNTRLTDQQLTHAIIGAAIEVHRALGLLEAVYEECLAQELTDRGIPFERQKPVPLVCRNLKLECGYRIDLLVAGRIVVEIKAIESVAPIHESIMLTYLRLSGCKIGLLINFYTQVLRDGIKRFVWHYEAKDEEKDNAEAQRTQRRRERRGSQRMTERKIRVLIAKPGLDGHDRGAKVIARALRDAGMEVIYTGLRQTPEMIASAAVQEDVDVIGLSILSGAHNTLCPRLMELLREQKMTDVTVLVGGIIPESDIAALKKAGIAEVFLPGTSTQDIVNFIRDRCAARQ